MSLSIKISTEFSFDQRFSTDFFKSLVVFNLQLSLIFLNHRPSSIVFNLFNLIQNFVYLSSILFLIFKLLQSFLNLFLSVQTFFNLQLSFIFYIFCIIYLLSILFSLNAYLKLIIYLLIFHCTVNNYWWWFKLTCGHVLTMFLFPCRRFILITITMFMTKLFYKFIKRDMNYR